MKGPRVTIEEQLPKRDWDPSDPPLLWEAVGAIAMLVLGAAGCALLYSPMIEAMIRELLKK